jgi:hypothetical protein
LKCKCFLCTGGEITAGDVRCYSRHARILLVCKAFFAHRTRSADGADARAQMRHAANPAQALSFTMSKNKPHFTRQPRAAKRAKNDAPASLLRNSENFPCSHLNCVTSLHLSRTNRMWRPAHSALLPCRTQSRTTEAISAGAGRTSRRYFACGCNRHLILYAFLDAIGCPFRIAGRKCQVE